MVKRFWLKTFLSLGLIATAAVAEEQQPASTGAVNATQELGADPEGDASPLVLEEITITASKRDVSLRDYAGSVGAFTGKQIEDTGIQDISELLDDVPGVTYLDHPTAAGEPPRVTVRGIAAGSEQSDTAGIFIDETPFSDPFYARTASDVYPFDLSTVEVLKGPVGTLFGGSALNGAVRYIPEQPQLGEFQGKFFTEIRSMSHSSDLGWAFGGAVNIPLGEKLALRVVAVDRDAQGWVDSENQTYKAKDVNSISQQSYRAILRWQPIDSLDMSLMMIDQDTNTADSGMSDAASAPRYARTFSPQPTPSDSEYTLWQFKGIWSFDWADLVFVASDTDKKYRSLNDITQLINPNPPASEAEAVDNSDASPKSQELRLVTNLDGNWDALIGIYNYDTHVTANNSISSTPNFFGGFLNSAGIIDAKAGEKAIFSEVNWRFAPGFQLTAGLRYYDVSLRGTQQNIIILPLCPDGTLDPSCPPLDLSSTADLATDENGFSPKLVFKWDINDTMMTYVSASRGFRFGGVNGISHPEVPLTYESDVLWSYEAGIRSNWLDGSLLFDATVFYIDWQDAQFRSNTTDNAASYTDNVGAADAPGFETQIIWMPPETGLRFGVSAAYSDVTTTEDLVSPTGAVIPSGSQWPRAPKWQALASAGWSGQLGPVQVSPNLSYTYFGDYVQGFFDNDPTIDARSSLDFQLLVTNGSEKWWPDLSFNIYNLTNEQDVTAASPGPNIPGLTYIYFYTQPRTFALRASWDF